MNSRSKGCRGERQWRDELRARGFAKAHRGQQFCGLQGNSDVVCPELPGFHFEVKRTERLNVYDAIEQAIRDGKPGTIPIVAHKRNHAPWLVVMTAESFFEIIGQSDLVRSPNSTTQNHGWREQSGTAITPDRRRILVAPNASPPT